MNLHQTIGFIGAGNMARCLLAGLIANEFPHEKIWASDPNEEKLHYLQQQFSINTSLDNQDTATSSNVIILAVKPQILKSVTQELAASIREYKPLVISIAAGIAEPDIRAWIGSDHPIVRCMPNLAAFVNSGATGMYPNPFVTDLQRELAEHIMRAVGIALWVDQEAQIDIIAALSGTGPAYFFVVMEALEKAAIELGLNPEDAHLLTLQTALGAAKIAMSTNETVSELRTRVTSKGGITESALAVLTSHQTQEAFAKALRAARDKSIEIARQYHNKTE